MKAKIMALILAVGLGTVGIAATAQAAAADGCTHPNLTYLYTRNMQTNYYNPQEHLISYEDVYDCSSCQTEVIISCERREPHDYEQVYLEDGRVYTYCTGCGDSYYF